MPDCSRREFARSILKTLVTYSLFDALMASDSFGTTLRSEAKHWSRRINEISVDLLARKLSSTEWQDRVEELVAGVNLPDLLTRTQCSQRSTA